LIKTLEDKLAIAEAAAKDQANTGIELARETNQNKIEWLKSNLEQTHEMAQTNQSQIIQQGELIG